MQVDGWGIQRKASGIKAIRIRGLDVVSFNRVSSGLVINGSRVGVRIKIFSALPTPFPGPILI
jgi:hypothetical protein